MEQATLGAMLIDRTAIEKAAEILRPEDFYRDAHRVVFESILGLVERDEPVDQLTDALPTAANAEYYARIVEEKSILRRLIDASNQIQALAHGEYENISEVVDSAERAVFGVAQRRMGAYFHSMQQIVDDVWAQI